MPPSFLFLIPCLLLAGAPDGEEFVYRPLPDIAVRLAAGGSASLAALSVEKPLFLTLIFTRCAGICSPLVRSLKSAAAKTGGEGGYRMLVLSFDPRDRPADLEAMAERLGLGGKPDWMFGTAAAGDVKRLSEATGFWFRWDAKTQQYDHPGMLMAVHRGRILRWRAGGSVPAAFLAGVLEEARGKFVRSHPVGGDVAFRCFQYDEATGAFAIDWGMALVLAPGLSALLAAAWIFRPAARS